MVTFSFGVDFMKTIVIQGSTGHSTVRIGETLGNLSEYVPAEKVVIITDSNVRRYYQDDFPPYEIIEIGTGEQIKNLDTVQKIYKTLLHLEADRSSFIVGIGGGIVCDITGFAASTYLRGVRFGFVSTTLLSQVDASVGGKNGVNFAGYKNMVGVFNQPQFVICDLNLLRTLPDRERLCGFAEIVKHGTIADVHLFSYLEENYKEVLSLDTNVMERLVYDSVNIKADIVNRDEKESGERKKLNFGHTFGHALEKVIGIPHGEAISIGMRIAARLSEKMGCLRTMDAERLEGLLKKLKLPIRLAFDKEEVLDAIRKDKKRKGDRIDFVMLHDIGKAVVEDIAIKDIEKAVMEL